MTAAVVWKLLALVTLVLLGWFAGRRAWLGGREAQEHAARVVGDLALYLLVPALLFRTTARFDMAALPWRLIAAYFIPVVGAALLVSAVLQARQRGRADAHFADPPTRAISMSFGNSVQLGIPFAAAVFGEAGLAVHVTLVSLHALLLLPVLTVWAEWGRAAQLRPDAGGRPDLRHTALQTIRHTLIHPVVLPVVAGLLWNLAGAPLPPLLDETLQLLAQAVVPVCLLLIGLTLALRAADAGAGLWRRAAGVSVAKLIVLPALVAPFAHFVFGLDGLTLAVVTMMAALPVGTNALIFAQRYRRLEAEATAAIVVSTVLFAGSAALWLALLAAFGIWPVR